MAAGASSWGSRSGFILASVGFAVGLGNIWRFPYVTGENGGSAFVLIYLLCAFGIGVPILMAEFLLGRRGAKSPPFAITAVTAEAGLTPRWSWVGNLTVLTAFGILMSYAVVAGWVLYYFYKALLGDMLAPSAATAQVAFDGLLADPRTLIFWGGVALLLAGTIIASGVQQGIERAVKILMPMLFALLVLLMVFNVFVGGMPAALEYLFTPDFSKVDGSTFLAALSQAFFSIGVAMAGMMMFGSYLPKNISIAQSAMIIVAADTRSRLAGRTRHFPHGVSQRSGCWRRHRTHFSNLTRGLCADGRRGHRRRGVLLVALCCGHYLHRWPLRTGDRLRRRAIGTQSAQGDAGDLWRAVSVFRHQRANL